MLLMIAVSLVRSFYKRIASQDKGEKSESQTSNIRSNPVLLNRRQTAFEQSVLPLSPPKKNMRYNKTARRAKVKKPAVKTTDLAAPCIEKTIQPYEVFLVLDLEGTCKLGTDFNYPNEIIVRRSPSMAADIQHA